MTTMLVCVRCGEPVMGPVPGVGGVPAHSGHADPRLDRTCGVWGYRRKEDADEETPQQ